MQEINSSDDLRNYIEFTTGMEENRDEQEQQIEDFLIVTQFFS